MSDIVNDLVKLVEKYTGMPASASVSEELAAAANNILREHKIDNYHYIVIIDEGGDTHLKLVSDSNGESIDA